MVKKEFVTLPLDAIIPYEKNPRINDDAVADTMESIKQCENLDPIEIDEKNVILSGHTRLKALKKLGYAETECVRYSGLSEDRKKKYRILANKVAEKSKWDIDLLASELDGLDFDGFDFGFDVDLDQREEDPVEVREDDYELALPEKPKSKPGDIYQLGRHRLMCGDSLSPENIALLMDGCMADMILTDPPYNVDYEGTAGKIKNDNMEDEHFRRFLTDTFKAADGVLKPGGAVYIWHADSEGFNFRAACKDAGWNVRQCLIWNKNSLVMGRQDYQWKHEPCLYLWKEGAAHFWNNDRSQTTVIDCDKPKKNDIHPTMKPVKLFDYLIQNSSRKDEIVLDMFGGSGTTIIACEQDGRAARVMELDPRYVDAAVKRWEEFTGEKAVLINGGEINGMLRDKRSN
jgi:site-specific DNA-methyltransferase (adenine-specific)